MVNLPDRFLEESINYCGSRSGAEGSKFAAAGLTHIFGRIVSRSVAKDYLSAEGRLLIDKLNPVIYAGDGVHKGFRFLQES